MKMSLQLHALIHLMNSSCHALPTIRILFYYIHSFIFFLLLLHTHECTIQRKLVDIPFFSFLISFNTVANMDALIFKWMSSSFLSAVQTDSLPPSFLQFNCTHNNIEYFEHCFIVNTIKIAKR
jgi:hypothetical protein